jgi:hypothetical protein
MEFQNAVFAISHPTVIKKLKEKCIAAIGWHLKML